MKTKTLFCLLGIPGMIMLFSCKKDTVSKQQTGIVSQRLMGGEDDEYISTVISTADGGHLVAATTGSNNSGDVRASHGSSNDWWIVRLNSNNDTIWTRTLGSTSGEDYVSAAATSDGGFVIAGSTNGHNDGDVGISHSPGHYDCWVVKLNSNGDIAWSRMLGGSNNDYGRAVTATADGNIVVAGSTSSTDGDVTGTRSVDDLWVIKLNNANGQLIWQKVVGGSNPDVATAITAATDGGVVVAGNTSSNNGDVGQLIGQTDGWIIKLDVNGGFVWKKVVGGAGMEWVNGISKTNDGGYVIAGSTYSNNTGNIGSNHGNEDGWVMKLKGNGDVEWCNTFGGTDYEGFVAVAATPDGGYLAGGYSESNNNGDVGPNKGDTDGWLVKLDANGQRQWFRGLGSNEYDDITALAINSGGSCTIGAGTSGNKNGDVSGTNHGNGTAEAWLIKFR